MTDDTPEALARAASRLMTIKAEIEELTAEANDIKAKLRAAYGVGWHVLADGSELAVRPQLRFSPARAAEVLPPELLALCTVGVVDSKRAREVLPPTTYDRCKVEIGEPVVHLVG